MRTDFRTFDMDIVESDIEYFTEAEANHFIDTDFDQIDPDVFRDLGRPINPVRKPWSDGNYF